MTSGRLIALFALAALVLGVTAQQHELLVRLAQVTHHHGARTPLTTANVPFICGDTYPCGALTDVGQQMLLAVGDFVRQRYNDAAIVGEPFFPATHYNASLIRSRSTSMERTLQSSTSFLHSIFTNETEFFPVVYTVDVVSDYLLNTNTFPTSLFEYVSPMRNTIAMNSFVDLYFTHNELVAMAKEVHLPDVCDNYETRGVRCAYDLYDIATAFNASGRIHDFPLLMAAQTGLADVQREWFRLMYSYNLASEDFDRGSSVARLGNELIQNMLAYMKEPTFKVYEYSTSDVTMAPLGAILGDQGNITMLPDYGTTIIVELVEDTTYSEYFVRVIRGQPMLQPDGSYVFEQQPFNLKCAKTSPFTPYDAEGSICSLEDFSNFVLSHLPGSANGECKVDGERYADLQCPDRPGVPVHRYCLAYRKRCPAVACPENQVLSAVDWQCYPIASNAPVCVRPEKQVRSGGISRSAMTMAAQLRDVVERRRASRL